MHGFNPTFPIFREPPLKEMRDAFATEKRFKSCIHQWHGVRLFMQPHDFVRGSFFAFNERYKYVLDKSKYHNFFSLRARSFQSNNFFVGIFDSLSSVVYGEVLPLKFVPYEDKEYYINMSLIEIYNPSNKLYVSPSTYNKSLSMLFPMHRKSLRGKLSKTFRPLGDDFKLRRTFFSYNYEWNLYLIRKHKQLLLRKHLKRYAKEWRLRRYLAQNNRGCAERQGDAPAVAARANEGGQHECTF